CRRRGFTVCLLRVHRLRSRFGSRLWVSILLLPAASFADRQSCERSCLSQSRGPGMACAHRSMNAGPSAEKPFAPRRGGTESGLNYPQQRRTSVADETSKKRSCAFEGG